MRVLEVSASEGAAAYCGKLFARWGAAVTRVEPRFRDQASDAEVVYLHGGKALERADLSDPEGRARLQQLAVQSDLVVCDLAVDEMEPLLPTLSEARILLLITPFGRTGPYRGAPATASTLLALGGYTFLSGDPRRTPLTLPGNYPYYQAGSYGYVAALAEYLRGGADPVTIDVSVLETLATLHQFTDVMWNFERKVRRRHGNRWENLYPTTLLPAKDGWVALNVLPNFWEPFALWIGGAELLQDPRFATNETRMAHQDELDEVIDRVFSAREMEDLFREGQERWRVPIGYAPSLHGTLEDRHLQARQFFRPLTVEGRELRTAGSPFHFVEDGLPEERAPGDQPRARPWSPLPRPVGSVQRPLQGIRVVDLTRIWSGPLATRMLADLGADVVKVEAPTGRGPRSGARAGGGAVDPAERPWNRQGLFNKLNRNKSSISVDLKDLRGRALFLRLVAESDVVIENFSARAMPSLGLGYEALRAANPRIIYAPMPALGSYGPYRDYIGLGPSIEPLSGLTALMGYGPEEPRVTSQAITDAAAGVTAAASVVTALWRRERTGEGTMIDLSQGEAMSAYLGEYFVEAQLRDGAIPRTGNAHPRIAPHGVYPCAGDDQWIAIAATDERQWASLAAVAEQAWDRDVRFLTREDRIAHRKELDDLIAAWTAGQTAARLMARLMGVGVPAGVVYSAPEMLADVHLVARGYFAELETPDAGSYPTDGSPVIHNGIRNYESWRGAPGLGEHNALWMTRLGYSVAEVAELQAAGVVVDMPPAS